MMRFISHRLRVNDGVVLTAYERPGSNPDLPPVVFSNGLGGNLQTYRRIIEGFPAEQRIISWDYRGLHSSKLTQEQRRSARLDVARHAFDCLEVLDYLEVETALFVGWSMGVQLNWEVYRLAPERFLGVVAISGGAGGLLSRTAAGPQAEPMLRPGFALFGLLVTHLGPTVAKRPEAFMTGAAVLRLLHPDVDREIFSNLLEAYVQLDFEVYTRIIHGLGEHDARDVLLRVTCPSLLIVGERDPIAPPRVAYAMEQSLRNAELLAIPKGTHYLPMEFPTLINARIRQFTSQLAGYTPPRLTAV